MNPATPITDPQRARLRGLLLERGLNEKKLAVLIGTSPGDLCPALSASNKGFGGWRYRLRAERALGELIWTSPEEVEELRHIGKAIGADLLSDAVGHIYAKARKAGVPVRTSRGIPGFRLFAALIRHFLPQSATLAQPYYVRVQ